MLFWLSVDVKFQLFVQAHELTNEQNKTLFFWCITKSIFARYKSDGISTALVVVVAFLCILMCVSLLTLIALSG